MKKTDIYKVSIVFLFLVLLNILISFQDKNATLLPRKEYQLDAASIKIIENIQQPVIITFYRSDNLTSREQKFAKKIETILRAFKNQDNTIFNIDIINPTENLEAELDATNSGIKSIEIREQDKTLRRIFLGMIVQVGSRVEILPVINPQMGIEYLVSSSLRKLTETQHKKIAYVKGHHEPALSQLQDIEKILRPNYILSPTHINKDTPIDSFESLVIVGPSLEFTNEELNFLDNFLEQGKNIFIALDKVDYDAELQQAYPINTRLELWLKQKGILITNEFVVDNSCGEVKLEDVVMPINFPFFPQITNFTPHPTTNGVEITVLRYASPIFPMKNIEGIYTPLAKTSTVSGRKGLPLKINLEHEWSPHDYTEPEQTVAMLLELPQEDTIHNNAKIIVVSDSDFILDLNNSKGATDNYRFATNAIEWLSDDLGLFSIKQKGILKQQNQTRIKPPSSWMKLVNIVYPLIIIGLIAFYRFYIRHRQKKKEQRVDL